jgi:hypothetical protein
MRTLAVAVLAVLAVSARGAAQQPVGEVSGTVYDSVARGPLRGAIVQMVALGGAPLFTDSTDERGRFAFKAVPAGRYFVEFTHPVLDSLALTPPLSQVEVKDGQTARASLAVPSPETIITSTCRTTPADSATLFFGVLRHARTKAGLDSGLVQARWTEIVIDTAGIHSSEKRSSARTSRDGWFATCGVPVATDFIVQAMHGTDSTGIAIVTMPPHGLLRFDLDIGGVATIRGRVTSQGRPVPNALVRSGGDMRSAYTDSAGQYRLSGVAAGTQTVDVRALGYAPDASAVHLAPDAETEKNVELTTVKRVMDTIKVVAQRVYSLDSQGFERRRRAGWGGTFFDEDAVRRRAPYSVMQLLNDVPTLRVERSGFETAVRFRRMGRLCEPAFFLNGVRMPSELLADLDLFVRPHELGGMEVYRGQTPAEFFAPGNCGAIVVWTKRSPRRAR